MPEWALVCPGRDVCEGINSFQHILVPFVQTVTAWRDPPAVSLPLFPDEVFILELTLSLLTWFPKDCVHCCCLRLISGEHGRGLQLAEMWELASSWGGGKLASCRAEGSWAQLSYIIQQRSYTTVLGSA